MNADNTEETPTLAMAPAIEKDRVAERPHDADTILLANTLLNMSLQQQENANLDPRLLEGGPESVRVDSDGYQKFAASITSVVSSSRPRKRQYQEIVSHVSEGEWRATLERESDLVNMERPATAEAMTQDGTMRTAFGAAEEPFLPFQPSAHPAWQLESAYLPPRGVSAIFKSTAILIEPPQAYDPSFPGLPLTVYHQIFNLLDEDTSTCLGLTCKGFYFIHLHHWPLIRQLAGRQEEWCRQNFAFGVNSKLPELLASWMGAKYMYAAPYHHKFTTHKRFRESAMKATTREDGGKEEEEKLRAWYEPVRVDRRIMY